MIEVTMRRSDLIKKFLLLLLIFSSSIVVCLADSEEAKKIRLWEKELQRLQRKKLDSRNKYQEFLDNASEIQRIEKIKALLQETKRKVGLLEHALDRMEKQLAVKEPIHKTPKKDTVASEVPTEMSTESEAKKEDKFYTLIDDSLKPLEDEFYVKTIYSRNGKNRVQIARSNNIRSGNMFNTPIEYGEGDFLTENLKIIKIYNDFIRYLELKNMTTGALYHLRLSSGEATSRLVPQ